MARACKCILYWCMFYHQFLICLTSTHWVVTEDGKIHSKVDSLFSMRRPYDLVAFVHQEDRSLMLDSLHKELLNRKEHIDHHEDRDTSLEQRFYAEDPDCIAAGVPLTNFDLYISTVLPLENKGIRPEEHIDVDAQVDPPFQNPKCSEITELDFSIHSFEHLEGMKQRSNLSGNSELGLKNAITNRKEIDEFGHLVYQALQSNKTSWVLYNMAAFYWRIKGESYQVVECLRRALHHSPRMQKDVALISLANVLHRGRYSNEAAIVVHAALDISRELNVNHFTLGNIYAVLAEYNKSVICYENTLKIQPEFEVAAKRRHAVLCHSRLEKALEAQHRSLQSTLTELRDYQKQYEIWRNHQEKLLSEQATNKEKKEQARRYEHLKVQQSLLEHGEYCHASERYGRQLLTCSWGRKHFVRPEVRMGFSQESDSAVIPRLVDPSIDLSQPVNQPLFMKRMPNLTKMEEEQLEYLKSDWPMKEECDLTAQKLPKGEEYPATFLPAENKGFEVKILLAEAQGLSKGKQHPLPWYPPVCTTLDEVPDECGRCFDHIVSVAQRSKVPSELHDRSMLPNLLGAVDGDVTEEEVGQRILTALRRKIGPSWVLYNLAALYWRVNGNIQHAIECLRRSLYFVPEQFLDVPLHNLAAILFKWGQMADAIKVMSKALAVNSLEPQNHFLMGNLLSSALNVSGAVWHYEEVLHQNRSHSHAVDVLRHIKCWNLYHEKSQSSKQDKSKQIGCPTEKNDFESHVICRNDNGQKCQIDSKGKPDGNCKNCRQMCTVTPLKTLDGKSQYIYKGQKICRCSVFRRSNEMARSKAEAGLVCRSREQSASCMMDSSSMNPASEVQQYAPDFTKHLHKVSEYFLHKGMCNGDECGQLLVQEPTTKPHTQLIVSNGMLSQRLFFADDPSSLQVMPQECLVYNDGSKSDGCSREEFQPFMSLQFEPPKQWLLRHEGDWVLMKVQEDDDLFQEFPRHVAEIIDGEVTFRTLNHEDKFNLEEVITLNPDPVRHVKPSNNPLWPAISECQDHIRPQINFKQFASTWVSPAAKEVDISEYIDFIQPIEHPKEPFCMEAGKEILTIDLLRSVHDTTRLKSSPEPGLVELVQSLCGKEEKIVIVGTRIAHALAKHSRSWVVANIAGLYWRMRGKPVEAVKCLRLAYRSAPDNAKDIALLSLADLLIMSDQLDEALHALNMAIQVTPTLVATNFMIANVFAAKGDWLRATLFFDRVLTLQDLDPAKVRLKEIQCQRILSNPNLYQDITHLLKKVESIDGQLQELGLKQN